jgi:hypothetical protein
MLGLYKIRDELVAQRNFPVKAARAISLSESSLTANSHPDVEFC